MARNRFLNQEWQKNHLKKIKKRAGPHYIPELNVDLPIAEIFDGISRTKGFYYSIREHYGKLTRVFSRVSGKYENRDIQKIYKKFKIEISQLSNTLSKIKSYDTNPISWNQINKRTQKANEIEFLDKLREEKDKAEKQKSGEVPSNPQSISETPETDIHYLYETQKELRFFEELSSSTKAKLSNLPFLILTGAAGTGKTHLLCDLVENRLKKKLPAVLVFGELFETSDEPFRQIMRQLGLKEISKDQFLSLLNNAGKQSGCRAILAIDALNETRQRNFWKKNLKKVVDEIKKYPHIALVVSVRTGFEKEVITKKLKTTFVCEEHRGFEFREWEAVGKFFKEFQLPLPEIPLLMPEFQNPLFLLLFCKACQSRTGNNKGKKQRQVFRGHEGATYIFESFVDGVSKKIAKQFNIPNSPGKNIWDTIIEKIAERMVDKNDDRISEDELIDLVKKGVSFNRPWQFNKGT
jgi:chromosomal replication initiation ATPase DnaA